MASLITFMIGTMSLFATIMLAYTHPETDGFYAGLKLCCLLLWALCWWMAGSIAKKEDK